MTVIEREISINIRSSSFRGGLILVNHDTNKLLQELSFFYRIVFMIINAPRKKSAVQMNG